MNIYPAVFTQHATEVFGTVDKYQLGFINVQCSQNVYEWTLHINVPTSKFMDSLRIERM